MVVCLWNFTCLLLVLIQMMMALVIAKPHSGGGESSPEEDSNEPDARTDSDEYGKGDPSEESNSDESSAATKTDDNLVKMWWLEFFWSDLTPEFKEVLAPDFQEAWNQVMKAMAK